MSRTVVILFCVAQFNYHILQSFVRKAASTLVFLQMFHIHSSGLSCILGHNGESKYAHFLFQKLGI